MRQKKLLDDPAYSDHCRNGRKYVTKKLLHEPYVVRVIATRSQTDPGWKIKNSASDPEYPLPHNPHDDERNRDDYCGSYILPYRTRLADARLFYHPTPL